MIFFISENEISSLRSWLEFAINQTEPKPGTEEPNRKVEPKPKWPPGNMEMGALSRPPIRFLLIGATHGNLVRNARYKARKCPQTILNFWRQIQMTKWLWGAKSVAEIVNEATPEEEAGNKEEAGKIFY